MLHLGRKIHTVKNLYIHINTRKCTPKYVFFWDWESVQELPTFTRSTRAGYFVLFEREFVVVRQLFTTQYPSQCEYYDVFVSVDFHHARITIRLQAINKLNMMNRSILNVRRHYAASNNNNNFYFLENFIHCMENVNKTYNGGFMVNSKYNY